MKYRAFADEARRLDIKVPECYTHVTFYIPMPKTWSKQKQLLMDGQPHQQTPDVDNMLKALLDAVHKDDSHIWDIRATKKWSTLGMIEIIGIKE